MSTAAKALKREMAYHRRQLVRLQRAYEIVTGKRGIEGAPAEEKPKKAKPDLTKKPEPEKPEPDEPKAHVNGRKPGELVADVERLFSDGKGRTASEAAEAIGVHSTALYRPLRKHPKIKEDDSQFPAIFKMKIREAVTRPGEGVRDGRLK